MTTAATLSMRPALIQRPADKRWIESAPGERVAICVRSADVGGAYSVVELIAAPRTGPPLHIHEDADEVITILEGCVLCVCEDDSFDAPAGTTIVVPRGVLHGWVSLPDITTRMLLTFTPGGVEQYFEEAAGTPESEWEAVAKKHGTILVGLPLEIV